MRGYAGKVLLVAGCTAGCGGSDPDAPDAPAGFDAAATITLAGAVYEWNSPGAVNPPIAGTEVCL